MKKGFKVVVYYTKVFNSNLVIKPNNYAKYLEFEPHFFTSINETVRIIPELYPVTLRMENVYLVTST